MKAPSYVYTHRFEIRIDVESVMWQCDDADADVEVDVDVDADAVELL